MIEPANIVVAGMSGSPVISATGAALGVISTGSNSTDARAAYLTNSLPGWLLHALMT